MESGLVTLIKISGEHVSTAYLAVSGGFGAFIKFHYSDDKMQVLSFIIEVCIGAGISVLFASLATDMLGLDTKFSTGIGFFIGYLGIELLDSIGTIIKNKLSFLLGKSDDENKLK